MVSVTIGDGVTSIGEYVFGNCSSLVNVIIGDNVTTIGNSAFAFCNSLSNVTIGKSVAVIGEQAFMFCLSLTNIVIPDSVTSIGEGAFVTYGSLAIYCEATEQPSGWSDAWIYSDSPVYWYSEGEPTSEGNYWHYVDGVVTIW